jgi:sec-independent protein translocase protein TatC
VSATGSGSDDLPAQPLPKTSAPGTGTPEGAEAEGPPEEGAAAPRPAEEISSQQQEKVSPAQSRAALEASDAPPGGYQALSEDQRSAVSGIFFPDAEELDMDKSMPLEDHIKELRDGVIRTGIATVISIGVCLAFYKELTTSLEAPALAGGTMVKFVQLAPGEFFFVSVKVAIAVGLLLAFPYALFEAALYFTPALTKSERSVVGPTVLASSVLFYAGCAFAFSVLSPAALGFFLSYSEDVIESQFSIDQYFEFILSMGFATGIAFQVPVLQVVLGLFNVLKSEQLFAVWRYVIVASAIVGAILTPSTDPVTQLLLSGALCALYFTGAGALVVLGR